MNLKNVFSLFASIIIFLASSVIVFAQNESKLAVITGQVLDSESGNPIAGATIQIVNGVEATSTNSIGYFKLEWERGDVEIKISAIGSAKKFKIYSALTQTKHIFKNLDYPLRHSLEKPPLIQ